MNFAPRYSVPHIAPVLAAVAGAAYLLTTLDQHLLRDAASIMPQPAAPTPAERAAPSTEDGSPPASLTGLHLFGEKEGGAATPGFAPLGDSRLDAALSGVLQSPRAGESVAIISVSGGPATMYREGDELSAGVRIETIGRDHVVLHADAGSEILPLPRPRSPDVAATPANPQPGRPSAQQRKGER
jgi:type II secretory pathway component PulC